MASFAITTNLTSTYTITGPNIYYLSKSASIITTTGEAMMGAPATST